MKWFEWARKIVGGFVKKVRGGLTTPPLILPKEPSPPSKVAQITELPKSPPQIIYKNPYGVEYTESERKELIDAQDRANINRQKMLQRRRLDREIAYIPTDEDILYRERHYDLDNVRTREQLNRILNLERRWSNPNIVKIIEEQFRENLLKSLDDWPDIEPIMKLKKLIQSADARDLEIIHTDPHYTVSIRANYLQYLNTSTEELYTDAQSLYDRWETSIAMLGEQKEVVWGWNGPPI